MNYDLKDIVTALQLVRDQTKLKVDDNILFDGAIRIFNSPRMIKKDSSKEYSKIDEKATQKQIDLLYKLGIDFNAETIMKKEASVLIDKNKGKFEI